MFVTSASIPSLPVTMIFVDSIKEGILDKLGCFKIWKSLPKIAGVVLSGKADKLCPDVFTKRAYP